LSDPAQAEAAVSVEFLAESDGTPAVILVDATWTERFDGADVAVELAFEIELLTWDAVVSIRAPDDVWAVHESSEIGYSMAHPADWTVESTDGTDAFRLDGIEYIHVAPQELTAPATTDQFVEAILRSYEDDLDTRPDSNEPVTLGGQPARRLVLHLENAEGAPVVLFDYVTVRAGTGWEVYLATLAGTTEDRDLAFFETVIATFRFAG
jgi:hypothetical protein